MMDLFTSGKKNQSNGTGSYYESSVLHNNQRVHITFDEVPVCLIRVGDYVKQTSHPQWGIGRVIFIGEGEKVTIFFLQGGKRIFCGSSPDLEEVNFHHRDKLSRVGPRQLLDLTT
jgi:hypothetical protein